jgi:hypothetical protein
MMPPRARWCCSLRHVQQRPRRMAALDRISIQHIKPTKDVRVVVRVMYKGCWSLWGNVLGCSNVEGVRDELVILRAGETTRRGQRAWPGRSPVSRCSNNYYKLS